MRLEMDGREPLIVLFGVPFLTTVVVLGAYYFGVHQGSKNAGASSGAPVELKANVIIPKDAIQITNKISSPRSNTPNGSASPAINATLVLPEGSIQISNRIVIPDSVMLRDKKLKKKYSKSEVVPVPIPELKGKPRARELVINTAPKIIGNGRSLKLKTQKALRESTRKKQDRQSGQEGKETQLNKTGAVIPKIKNFHKPRITQLPKTKPELVPNPVSMKTPKAEVKPKVEVNSKKYPNIPGPEGEVIPPPKGINVGNNN